MNLVEWCKLKKDNANLSEGQLAIKAWDLQRQQMIEELMQQEQKRFEKAAEQEIGKSIEKVIEKALTGGKANLDIKINL